jgi:hypothetical protein
VYLHDDWAGIDTGSVVVTLSGIDSNGNPTIVALSGGDLVFTPFSWSNAIYVLTTETPAPIYRNVYSLP